MCGIVGYIGPQDATAIILNGLKRLEYRGYDSAGLAVIDNDHIEVRREVGKLTRLSALVSESPLHGHIGLDIRVGLRMVSPARGMLTRTKG